MNSVVISRTSRFNESLNRLRLSGGIASDAAKDAARIIGNITTMPAGSAERYGRLTKNGESRIKNCFKYDLSGGYRLVTVQIRDTAFLLFVGTHAEAERWLDTNRGLEPVINNSGKITIIEGQNFNPKLPLPSPPEIVLPKRRLVTYLAAEDLEFLNASADVAQLTHFSSDEEILAAVESSASPTASVLLDVLIHLRDYRTESATGLIYLARGEAQPLEHFQGQIAEEIKKPVNRDNLVNLRDLSQAEYEAILNGSVADWMLYLHPDQRSIAFDDYQGAVRLQGVAGSGKTSVLLHRAKYLAEKYPTENIAIFTLNPSLASLLTDLLADLVSPDTRGRIVVYDIESFARNVVREYLPERLLQKFDPRSTEMLEECFWDSYDKPEQVQNLQEVNAFLSARKVDVPRYLRDEFIWVRSAFRSRLDQSISTRIPPRDKYVDPTAAPRAGRAIPFASEYRAAILSALQFYEEHMECGGFADQAAVVLLAHSLLDRVKSSDSPFKFRAVLVDEVQDLSTVELELLHSCVKAHENGLFLVGDPEQQVYPKEHNLRKAGIEISTRRFFRKNYRNPREILEAGLELMKRYGEPGVDPEDEKLVVSPEYAARHSAKPLLVECIDEDDEVAFVAEYIKRRKGESQFPVCLILSTAREDDETRLSDFEAKFRQAGLETEQLLGTKKLQRNAVYLAGLETVKGFEFSRVFIAGIGATFPAPYLPDEEAWRDIRRLYVAMTRARDEVVLTYSGEKSRCFKELNEFFSETTSSIQRGFTEQIESSSEPSRPIVPRSRLAITTLPARTYAAQVEPVLPSRENDLRKLFQRMDLETYDKRDRGGCFWVVGGFELQPLMNELRGRGLKFSFTPSGSRTTRRRAAWYLK